MSDSFRKESCENKRRRGNSSNALARAVTVSVDRFLEDLRREDGLSADYLAEYELGLSGAALSQYRSDTVERDIPHWAVLMLTTKLRRLDLLRSTLSAIGVDVSWKQGDLPALPGSDLHTLMGLMANDDGKILQTFLQATAPNSDGGPNISHVEGQALAQVAHHMRRVVDDLDDRLTALDLGDMREAR